MALKYIYRREKFRPHTVLKPNSWTYSFVEVSGTILRVLRLVVSVYNVNITNQYRTTFARGGGGGGIRFVKLNVNR